MKPWLTILLTVVVAGVVVGGGVYAYQSQNAMKEKDELQSKITELETQKTALQKELNDLNAAESKSGSDATTEASGAVDPLANWKTYSDSVVGYSVKYPTDYKVTGVKTTTMGFGPSAGYEGPAPLSIDATKPVPSVTLDVYIDNQVTNEKTLKDCKKTTLDNKQAYECIDLGMVNYYSVVSLNNGYIFKLTLTAGKGDGETTTTLKADLTTIQKNMLNSFKFSK